VDVAEAVDTLVSALDDLRKLERQYEQQMSTLSTERIALEAQEDVLKRVKHDLSRDYTFAVEEIPEDSVECPICGTEHHNGFAARFGLAEDLGTTEDLLGEVRTKLADVRQSIADLRETLGSHRDEVRRVSTLLTEKKGEISK
jgi:DNA repair exonuclease SbcCD ATPase subunit